MTNNTNVSQKPELPQVTSNSNTNNPTDNNQQVFTNAALQVLSTSADTHQFIVVFTNLQQYNVWCE